MEQKKGSVVRLNQHIRKYARDNSDLANLGFNTVLEVSQSYPEGIRADIATVVETLYFNHEEQMKLLYGNNITDLVLRCTDKISLDGLTKQEIRDSYNIADRFKEVIQRNTFEHLKDKCA